MMYQNQYPMMNQQQPIYAYGQIPTYSYPLSYSQVSAQGYHQMPPPLIKPEIINIKDNEAINNSISSPISLTNQKYGNAKSSENFNFQPN